ncbi:MAG TPA: copper chaperone PCu(A)C [Pseudomonadales bacterium]|nr:copper chaperone PCu(A)C [Pseudomonadales bacterium]
MKKRLFAAIFMLTSQALADGIIEDAYVRDLIPGRDMSAGFFVFSNTGDAPIVLVAATSSAAESVEMHSHVHEDGMMKMRPMTSVTVAPNDEVVFEPGGHHLMLFKCDAAEFKAGQVTLVMTDAEGNEYRANAEVRSPHHMHH